MNTKWFVVPAVFCIGIFATSGALADKGDLACDKVQALSATGQNSGNTSDTIFNPEGRGDTLIFPYYDAREITEYIEVSYNRQRRQARLEYLFPSVCGWQFYARQLSRQVAA